MKLTEFKKLVIQEITKYQLEEQKALQEQEKTKERNSYLAELEKINKKLEQLDEVIATPDGPSFQVKTNPFGLGGIALKEEEEHVEESLEVILEEEEVIETEDLQIVNEDTLTEDEILETEMIMEETETLTIPVAEKETIQESTQDKIKRESIERLKLLSGITKKENMLN